jgi:adenylate kinase family enzyme
MVKERLDKPDCRLNGWILDGCPSTPEQIAALTELGVSPSLVVTLDQSDSSVYEKIEQRRFDPVECKRYDLLKDEVPREVRSRLIHQREHTHPIVKRRLQEYRNFLATVESEYSKRLIRINAEETENDPTQVYLSLCDAIENIV